MPADDHSISIPHLVGLIVGALCISFASIFAVLSMRIGGIGYFDSAFWRMFIGTVTIGIVMGFLRRKHSESSVTSVSRFAGWLWVPGLAFAGDFATWHWSFAHTSVANATLLANVAVLIVTLFAWLVWKERISHKFVTGAGLALCGVVVLMLSSKNRIPPTNGNPVFGDFLALGTAFFYGSYQLSMKYYRRERSAPELMFWASAVAALCLLPVALLHPDQFLPSTAAGWWPLIGVGVVSHACGQGLIAWGLGGVQASLATVVLLVQPLTTAILGVVILGQPLVPWQVLGGFVVLIGLFVAIRGQMQRKPPGPVTPTSGESEPAP